MYVEVLLVDTREINKSIALIQSLTNVTGKIQNLLRKQTLYRMVHQTIPDLNTVTAHQNIFYYFLLYCLTVLIEISI